MIFNIKNKVYEKDFNVLKLVGIFLGSLGLDYILYGLFVKNFKNEIIYLCMFVGIFFKLDSLLIILKVYSDIRNLFVFKSKISNGEINFILK